MITKNKSIILNLLDNGTKYFTYYVDKDRFMLDKETGSILYPEVSNFKAAELIDITKELTKLWKQNPRELPMFVEVNL